MTSLLLHHCIPLGLSEIRQRRFSPQQLILLLTDHLLDLPYRLLHPIQFLALRIPTVWILACRSQRDLRCPRSRFRFGGRDLLGFPRRFAFDRLLRRPGQDVVELLDRFVEDDLLVVLRDDRSSLGTLDLGVGSVRMDLQRVP